MVSFKRTCSRLLKPGLGRLQDLQTELFRQLQLLLPDQITHYDSFRSRVAGSPLLRLDILERHPYTHFLRLTYQFSQGPRHAVAPDAHIRVYNDARLAEVTAFNPQQGFARLAHPLYPHQHLLEHSWKQNRALDKWLSYLLHQGHGVASMQPADDGIGAGRATPKEEPVASS